MKPREMDRNRRQVRAVISLALATAMYCTDVNAWPQDGGRAGDANTPQPVSEQLNPYWRSIHGGWFLSVAYTEQGDSHDRDRLGGVSLSWGGWEEDPYQLGFSKSFVNGW